jgi:hypothetical protein
MPAYDEELWTFMDQMASRNLENISGADFAGAARTDRQKHTLYRYREYASGQSTGGLRLAQSMVVASRASLDPFRI